MTVWWNRAPLPPLPSEPLLDALWARYSDDVPAAGVFSRLAGRFANDHLALRSVARPGSGIALFAKVFEARGWAHAGDYVFPDVHLRAIHLSRPGYPRVFISEIDPAALPADARAALLRLPADAPPPADDTELARWFRAPLPPSGDDLDVLGHASQYGAWLLAFGRRVNHFTASVADIEGWQARMIEAGVEMKRDIEGAPGSALRQTATLAADVDVLLRDGTRRRQPYAYLELAERADGFDGFLAPQARQLFEMTAPALGDRIHRERRHARKTGVLHVELGYGELRVPVMSENVSLGGMFLQIPDDVAPAQNDVLQLKIDLPDRRVEALATVVFHLPGRGVGVEFQWWDDEANPERHALAGYLRSLD